MSQGPGASRKRLSELFKTHWKIGAVMSLANVFVLLMLVFFFMGVDMFYVDGSFSLAQFKKTENLFYSIPFILVFVQFLFCLYPTVIGFLARNDSETNIGHQRDED